MIRLIGSNNVSFFFNLLSVFAIDSKKKINRNLFCASGVKRYDKAKLNWLESKIVISSWKKINKTKKCREFIQVQGWDGWPIIHHSSRIKLYHSRSRANRYVPPSACFVCDGIAFALPNSHLFDSSEGNVITNP